MLKSSLSIMNHFTLDSWSWASSLFSLFSVLAGGTQGALLELGGGGLNLTSALAVGQDAISHQELKLLLQKVTKMKVPSKKLLLSWGQVHVGMGDGGNGGVECLGDQLVRVIGVGEFHGEVGLWVSQHFDQIASCLGASCAGGRPT